MTKTFESWLADQEISPLSAEAYWAEKAWYAARPATMRPLKIKPRTKNRRQGARCASGQLGPAFKKQNCGHTFNSLRCAVCPYCERAPARFFEGPYTPPVYERIERAAKFAWKTPDNGETWKQAVGAHV